MTSPRTILSGHDISPKKSLGQNFLCDPQAAEMIVRKCGLSKSDVVVEVGPGTGALTLPAARQAAWVYAIETDGRLIEPLKETVRAAGLDNVTVLHRDIMKTDIREIYREAGRKLVVLGNLPYYISSQILMDLVEKREAVDRAVLMFQQELARRIAAPPGNREYGRISVALRYCAELSTVARLKPNLFFPRPGVDSEVVRIVFRPWPGNGDCDEALFFAMIKSAFATRRKTIKNALSAGMTKISASAWEELLVRAGVVPTVRAETLDVGDFLNICRHYKTMSGSMAREEKQ